MVNINSNIKLNGSVGQVLGRTGKRTPGSTAQRTIKSKTTDELRNSGPQNSNAEEETSQAEGLKPISILLISLV